MPEMDFTLLDSRDTYALYFNHLSEVFSRLTGWYRRQADSGNHEARIVRNFLERLLYTVAVLRLKYTHHPSHSLKVDVTDSGFPSSLEVMKLDTDLARRDKALRDMPPESVLKREALDFMFDTHQEPSHLLWRLCERRYLEMLDRDKLFLSFTPGILERVGSKAGSTADSSGRANRSYALSWACFDYATSRPYIHVMSFDHDRDQLPLEARGTERGELMRVVQQEGSRAPDVGILAMALDAGLPRVHPKIVKRICVGPLFSRFLLTHEVESEDPLCKALARSLSTHGRRPDDFVLFFDDEVVFSRRQEISRQLFGLDAGVREIFHIPESDPDCYRRRASVVHRQVLLPHYLLQHLQVSEPGLLPDLKNCSKITYTENGEFHGIAC